MPKIIFRPNPTPPPFVPPVPPTPIWPYVSSPDYEAYFPVDGILSIQRTNIDDPTIISKGGILLFDNQVFAEEIPCNFKSLSSEDVAFTFSPELTAKVQSALYDQSANFVIYYTDGTTEQFLLTGS